jgi:NAD(P)-dependent dehydrogenase (short-subunit alcohol dehydrogenase family)
VAAEPAVATVEMVHAAGGTMVSLQPCHLGDPADCARLIELAVSEFGRIDVLYSKASPTRIGMPPARTRSTWFSTSPVRHGLT